MTTCTDCKRPLGGRFSDKDYTTCTNCRTKRRIKTMLNVCPKPGDPEWDGLEEFEQTFLPSVRQQFAQKGTLTERQYAVLERIYQKV